MNADPRQRNPDAQAAASLRWQSMRSLVLMLAFWLAVMGGLYLLMGHLNKPRQSEVTAQGHLAIPRHTDGHFHIAGTVNGEPVMFMVDTGASIVSITEAVARRAGLPVGEPATFRTANGTREGHITRADTIVLRGGLSVSNLRVSTGLGGRDDDTEALLGQNFLQHFDVEMSRTQLILRPRAR